MYVSTSHPPPNGLTFDLAEGICDTRGMGKSADDSINTLAHLLYFETFSFGELMNQGNA